jgi:DNA modification methylase
MEIEIKSEDIELVDVEKLIPYDKNMNEHTDEQIDRLVDLIEYQGWRDPIIAQRGTNIIAAGHGRVLAAKKKGIEKVPVSYQEFENEAQFYAFVTSHNAINSNNWGGGLDLAKINVDIQDLGPELNVDMLGIKDFTVEPLDRLEPQSDEDEVPEVKDPITKRGDVWILGNHRVMCGDSTMIDDVEKLMNGEKADMVFTDPPYNINFKPPRGTHDIIKNDNMSDSDFKEFLYEIFSNCKKIMKIDTYLISFMGWSTIPDFKRAIEDCLFEIKSMPIWVKNNFGIGYYTRPKYEPLYLCLNGKPEKPKKAPADVFEFNKVHKTIHSCEKPVDMILGIIDYFNSGGIFYEPFLGSGSTLIACEKTKRKCYGMELDEHYCDVIVNRWQNYTGGEAFLESTKQSYSELKGVRDANA